MIVLGFLLGIWRARWVCRRRMVTEPEGSPRRVDPDAILDIGVMTLFSGVIGARLLFVALDFGSFSGRGLDIFKIWAGGMSLHGSIIGGLLYIAYTSRRRKISLAVLADFASPVFAIAYAFGRIGCFLNGCCYGVACDLPWATRFQDERHPGLLTPPSHPIQLYGTLASLITFAIVARWERLPRRDGEIFWGHVALYGLYRGAVEYLRAGATSDYLLPSLHLTLTHIISLLMVLGGVCGVLWLRRNRPAIQDAAFAPS